MESRGLRDGQNPWDQILASQLINNLKLDRTPDTWKKRMIKPPSRGHGEDELRQICEGPSLSARHIVDTLVKMRSAGSRKDPNTHWPTEKGVYSFMALKTQESKNFRIISIQGLPSYFQRPSRCWLNPRQPQPFLPDRHLRYMGLHASSSYKERMFLPQLWI